MIRSFLTFMLTALAVLTSAQTQPRMPIIPEQFVGIGFMTVPFFGKAPTKEYFDYPGQRQRLDQTQMGTTVTYINFYTEGVQYTITNGQCTAGSTTGDTLYSYALPPWASFVKNQTLGDGSVVEEWKFSLPPAVQVDVLVQADPMGKNDIIRRNAITLPFIGTVQMDYNTVNPGPFDMSVFDQSKFGCPPLHPPPHFSVTGMVIDAVTGQGISTKLSLAPLGLSIMSSAQGTFAFDDPALTGNGQLLTISAFPTSGYLGNGINFTLGTTNIVNALLVLSPTVAPGSWRVVLTWGSTPRDLDSHLLFAKTDGMCETFYSNKQCVAGAASASLDQDRTQGYGPETLSVSGVSALHGAAKHFVYIYSADGGFRPDAVAKLYGPSGLYATLQGPSSSSPNAFWSTWNFLPDGSVVTVNSVSSSKPSPA